jgi:outer membrane protein OmpA-like peptidoglycan-associated protein
MSTADPDKAVMRMLRSSAAAIAVVSCSLAGLASCAPKPGPKVQPAVAFLASAVQRHALVAIAEHHGATETMDFLAALLRHPGVPGTVNDIVVEFGNARYQAAMDAFIAGKDVRLDDVSGAWENTTQVTGVWSSPIYAAMVADVRAVNAGLPPEKRFRVLLGDPPIEWSAVTSPADEDMNDWRDSHFAWVVDTHVVRRNRRAILFIGGAHLGRRSLFPNSLIHLLDARYPGRTLVADLVVPDRMDASLAARVSQWPVGSAAAIRGSWLGKAEAAQAGYTLSTGTLEQNIDVAIYLSPRPLSTVAPVIDWSSPYGLELRRRQALTTLPFRTGGVRFEAGAIATTRDSAAALASIAAELRRDTSLRVTVKAFADGTEADGDALSRGRAEALVARLVADGISRERLTPLGCSASRPLWHDDTAARRAANRRAELVRTFAGIGCTPPTSFE